MRSKIPVYIHTRSRLHLLDKTLPNWIAQPEVGRITLVVEPEEYWATLRKVKEKYVGLAPKGQNPKVAVLRLPTSNGGMGAARSWSVRHAFERGIGTIIMSDDDHSPRRDADVRLLEEHIRTTGGLGIGVCVSYYGLALGNDFIRDSCEAVPINGSWGYACFALNVPLAVSVGQAYGLGYGFDPELDVGWEDQELCRMGIMVAKKQWHIHTGVMATSHNKRYAPGGIADLIPDIEERHDREEVCHELIWKRWGSEYISDPEKRYRCNWSRMLKAAGLK